MCNVRKLRRADTYRRLRNDSPARLPSRARQIRAALADGKPIPTELRAEEGELRREIALEDDRTGAAPTSHVDDEYAHAGEREPKILLTTSRDPSSKLAQFAKELKLVLPNAQRMNRGTQVMSQIVEASRSHDFTDIVVVHEHRGEPDGLVVCHLPFGPTAYFGVANAVSRHDIRGGGQALPNVKEEYPHLIFDNFTTALGERTKNILRHLFPPGAKEDAKRVMCFANRRDYVSFRHFTYVQPRGASSVELTEVGPRFELKLFQIKLGTMDQAEADTEYVLRSFTNTSKKKRML